MENSLLGITGITENRPWHHILRIYPEPLV